MYFEAGQTLLILKMKAVQRKNVKWLDEIIEAIMLFQQKLKYFWFNNSSNAKDGTPIPVLEMERADFKNTCLSLFQEREAASAVE